MTGTDKSSGQAADSAHLPKSPDGGPESGKLLSDSKLGADRKEDDMVGDSDEAALSQSKLGTDDDGGRKGQGGMRDPSKTSDAEDRLKPS